MSSPAFQASNAPQKVPLVAPSEFLSERPGEPDCPYLIKTQKCKFGMRCKFNHLKDKLAAAVASENSDVFALPERPSEPPCAFYLKMGQCKFGATCKFHHPKDIQIPSAQQENKIGEIGTTIQLEGTGFAVKPPALSFNSKELPVRPVEPDCPFYLKTGRSAYLQVWSHLGMTKENRKGTMRQSCCCLHHALSAVGNTSFGEKKATQLTTLVLQFLLPKAQSINCNFYFIRVG
ncbi:unnamed protein product [Prunus armeniaca]|uniref:C3H1-type domain-containing protein n=1 Tax=Prunus armeniaca TaxID=36596 RepID=A0A6J5VKM9_PRUAR|nr:unnamed protein product [Prunus armeniaca]